MAPRASAITLTFVPIGSSVEGWNRFEGRVSSVVAVHLAPAMAGHDANDISKTPPSLYFESDNLKGTLQKLQSVLDGSGIDDHAYAETLGLLLLWELRHAADPKQSRPNPVRGGLTVHQLRRIKEFIDAKISNDITISDLAELSLKVGDGGNREGGISWGCLTPPLLHQRSDMPCPKITSSS
jgi:AraC family transcriptional regulator